MLYFIIFYIIGIVICIGFEVKLGVFTIIFIAIAVIFLQLINRTKESKLLSILFMILIMAIGYIYCSIRINTYDNKYSNGHISGDFRIISLDKESNYYKKYICENNYGDRFIVQIKKIFEINFKLNDSIYLEGEFKLPSTARNEGGFNYRRYLNSKKIFGTITVNSNTFFITEKGDPGFINKIRSIIENTFSKLLPQKYAGIINGMLNGDTKNIPEDVLEDFKNSGVTHLLAVSGSNIAYIIMFLSLTSNKIFGKYLSYYIMIISIIIFIFVSGASASVARAGIMAILNIVAILFSRKSNTINNISFSALILLIINPLTVFDVGFILSFAGTLGIVLLSPRLILFMQKYIKIKFISETISITISAQLILFPIMLYYFNTMSILSLITNLLIVPISGFLTILGFITVIIGQVSVGFAKILAYAIYSLISFMLLVTNFFGKITWSNVLMVTPKIWMIAIYYIIICANINNFKYKKLVYKFTILFIFISFILNSIPRDYINLNMIDVGQGDSIYIETPSRKTVLIDGGGSEGNDYDVGENILVPYLLDKGKKKIDLIIVSHPHEDHIEGIITVVEKLRVSKVIISKNINDIELTKKLRKVCTKRGVKIIEVSAGDIVEIDKVKFKIIYPSIKDVDANLNNMSLVVLMEYGKSKALFTGDLEVEGENKIFKNINADILKVGHHGSNTSTSKEFIRRVNPCIALISVGEGNSYGHPSDIVLNNLEKKGVKIYRTDLLGEIKFKISKDMISIKNEWLIKK